MRLKKVLLSLFIISSVGAYAQIGINTNSPDASAALDITSTGGDKGLLIPRVTLTANLSNPSPVTNPATGLLVFNTRSSNQPIGIYFWDGSQWVVSSESGAYWKILGNSGTNPTNNFVGTTDNQHLAFRTNNTERMRVMADGRVVVGATAPYYPNNLFTVIGNSTQNWAINGYSNYIGVYGNASTGVYGLGTSFGLYGFCNDSTDGAGIIAGGNNVSTLYYIIH